MSVSEYRKYSDTKIFHSYREQFAHFRNGKNAKSVYLNWSEFDCKIIFLSLR